MDNTVVHKVNEAAIDFMSVVNPTSNFATTGKVIGYPYNMCGETRKESERFPSPAFHTFAVQHMWSYKKGAREGSFPCVFAHSHIRNTCGADEKGVT